MKKLGCSLTAIFLLANILVVTLISFIFVAYSITDITPPQLTILEKDFYTPDPETIVHGLCYDESGIQQVTVNSEIATAWFTDIHCSWQRTVFLNEGQNTIVVTAYDNSPNHNEVTETFTITYQIENYEGPTVQIVPISIQPSNNATIQCVVDTNGFISTSCYLYWSSSTWANAPFNHGRSVETYSGVDELLFTYSFEPHELEAGASVSYIFRISNKFGTVYSEIGTFEVTDPIPIPDTDPPELSILQDTGDYCTPNSAVIIPGSVWDDSGVQNVTVNDELVTGYPSTPESAWFFWQKTVNLVEGANPIIVKAYDNSPDHLMSEKSLTVTYQPSDYSGPTISSLPETDITANTVTLNCVINPQGCLYADVYLWLSGTSYENAPFQHGISLGRSYSGTEDIIISYTFEGSIPEIAYMFYVSNGGERAYTEVNTVILNDAPVEGINAITVVSSVIDGDTFETTSEGTVRLADIDAPEYDEDGYQDARDYLTSLVNGKIVYLDIDSLYVTDYYGTGNRTVCMVYLDYNATHYLNINQALVQGGFAVSTDFENDFSPDDWTLYVHVDIIPEFSSLLLLSIFFVVTIIVSIVNRRKQ